MSRGGSAFRGSRRSRTGATRIPGIDGQADYDLELNLTTGPGVLFPKRELINARPLSKDEQAQIAAYKSIRKAIHEGPLFTVLDEGGRARTEAVTGSSTLVISDPFENGVETYGMRYVKGKRKAASLEEGEYVLKYFPVELWGVLDSRYANSGVTRKRTKADLKRTIARLDALVDEGEEKGGDEDGVESDEEPPEAALIDDNFEEDEDEMAGDYNAEQYFDDGGDDGGDDYDGGDGGGDD